MPIRKRRCKDCGKTDVYLSRKGLCVECAVKRCAAIGIQIKEKHGPAFKAWKASMKKYLDL